MAEPAPPPNVCLDGEIVEIIESGGVCSLRVLLHHLSVLDLAPRLLDDLHLGDRIVIDGVLHVRAVRALPDSAPLGQAAAAGVPRDND